ncbi:MAG: hypothetical protein HON40_05795 [Flavobacteriales bacterium]|jgi:hypothetical protein|nr:hypothetical protein [Flavobacteriales bacterium]
MKKILFILCTPLFLLAQTDENKHSIEWNTNLLFESSSLDKSFLNTMLYGGYITDSMKTNWINAGGKNNILYSEISNGLSYNFNFKKQSFGFRFADRNILNASFTDDLLRLGFEGNFHHQDKTLDFGGTSIRADRFQQYTFTYGTEIKAVKVSTSLSYLAGNHHLSYIIEKGSLYTAPFGTSLDIAYDMSTFVTDTASLSPMAHNGNGLALGMSTDFRYKEHDIHLSFTDLGFIMWNPESITLATDSSFNFQGIEIEDIFSFNDSLLEINNPQDDLPSTKNSAFKSYIPATFHLRVSGIMKNKYLKNYTLGVQGKWQPYLDNTPLSFAKIGQGFKESNFATLYYIQSIFNTKYCDIIPTLSHGGYGKNTNLGLALSKGKKHSFTVGTHHLEDVVNKNKAKAVSVYFNIKLQF